MKPPAEGFLGFWATYGSAITGGAVIVSAICAFSVVLVNRKIARRRATLDLILHIESDRELLEARNRFIKLKKSETRSHVWGTEDQRDSEEATTIRTTLNINELVAVSICEGVIDECVYRRWFNKAYIGDYRAMTGYIQAVREYKKNPAIFKEFEELALKWDADTGWYDKPGWWKRKIRALGRLFKA